MNGLRFNPLQISDGLTLENRLVVPPMASQTADTLGLVTEKTLEHYSRLAESGAGLVMVEYSFVALSGRSEPNQLGAHHDDCLPGLSAIATRLHQAGTKAGLQLTHCGGKGSYDIAIDLMGPSGIKVPAYDRDLEQPRPMDMQDIQYWKDSFINAAIRAEKAGFDLVEIHCAHGYGINQWLSPLTNQRDDEYGGCLKNRSRLLLEIVAGISIHAPSLSIMTRIPGQDLYPEGLTQNDMKQVAQWLVDAGVSILDISSGIGGWNRPKSRRGEGYLVEESKALQGHTHVPVIGVGGIQGADYIEQALENNWLDLAAVGRAILQDPAQFKDTHMSS
ncbi:NADH:flavin oxidoreductase [Spongorhabdus nitratireducens]